jgi:hypothetical protein
MAVTTIPTAGIADDAVDNTKLDLTDSYAFTGAVTGATDLVKITSTTVSSSVATVELTGISSTYETYLVTMHNVHFSADNAELRCQVGDAGGYVTDNYSITGTAGRAGSTTVDGIDQTSQASWDLCGTFDMGAADHESFNGFVYFYNLRQSSGKKHITGVFSHDQDGGVVVNVCLSGANSTNSILTKMKFGDLASSKTIDTGIFTLYGVKQ